MTSPSLPLSLRVPASTSNLGPGFDVLGLAISLFLDVEVLSAGPGQAHELVEAEGEAAEWPVSDNWLLSALERLAPAARGPALALRVRSEIPVARGLGSSGAAIAAGLLLGAHLAGRDDDPRSRLAALGCELEGHPENSTASLYGGCTLSVPDGDALRVVEQPIHPSIGMVVAWPPTPLATNEARKALPPTVPFADAVENPRRLGLLLAGLRNGDPELLRFGGEDRLHVPCRLPLIRGAAAALEAARAAGAWLATISGSGSALFALTSLDTREPVAAALRATLAQAHGDAEARVVKPVLDRPSVRIGGAGDGSARADS